MGPTTAWAVPDASPKPASPRLPVTIIVVAANFTSFRTPEAKHINSPGIQNSSHRDQSSSLRDQMSSIRDQNGPVRDQNGTICDRIEAALKKCC